MSMLKLTKLRKAVFTPTMRRGIISIVGVLAVWELGRRLHVPFFAAVPAPSEVVVAAGDIIGNAKFWTHGMTSFTRVLVGFLAAQLIGIPLGLAMAMNRFTNQLIFPPLEILRPIPPLAWVPTAIIFWPTTELSIAFVIFLGAFFTVGPCEAYAHRGTAHGYRAQSRVDQKLQHIPAMSEKWAFPHPMTLYSHRAYYGQSG